MENYEIAYCEALTRVENNIECALESMPELEAIDLSLIENSESTLDGWDYCYAIAIGLAGVFITTNAKFEQYLADIHKAASEDSGSYDLLQKFLGDNLTHKGDHIDLNGSTFMNRNGTNANCLFHRLLWGHDILSVSKDNPFWLMLQQEGLTGILQAVRHLLADTASKQGLPLPGSSYLDVLKGDGKTSNYLIQVAQKLSYEAFGNQAKAENIYSHMMTIRAQDIVAGTVVKLVSELYCKMRGINDNLRCIEIRLIAYAVNFFGEAAVGCVKQKGVPYINVPLAIALSSSFLKFCYVNNMEIKSLMKKTDSLHSQSEDLLLSHDRLSNLMQSIDSAESHIQALREADNNFEALAIFLEEEKK